MNKNLILIFILILGMCNFLLSTSSDQPHIPHQIILKLPPTAEQGQLRKLLRIPGIQDISYHSSSGYFVANTTPDVHIEDLVRRMQDDLRIEGASLNYMARICSTEPQDTYFSEQYSLNNTGQSFGQDDQLTGTSGSDINAPEGWDYVTGSKSTLIAIIDTGVASQHEDLVGKVSGGYDFVDDSQDSSDVHGHGTLAASLAAANTNNDKGIAGVCWDCQILSVRVMDKNGFGSYLAINSGIRYAVDQGVRVINLSLGGVNPSFILEDACEYAYKNGVVLVAATGNTGSNVLYPAAYDDYCLAVGATDYDDKLASFSNYGPQVDVVAPGVAIMGAHFDPKKPDTLNGYYYNEGTSFAAPLVSGAAGLLISLKPNLTQDDILNLIKYTADDINQTEYPGVDPYMGYGRINLKILLGPFILE